MTNPFYDPYRLLSRVYQNGAHLKIALAEEPIEELHRARTVKTVYGVLENDGYLSLCIRTFAPKTPKAAVRIVLKIALYHLVFLKKPRYMVTDTAADLLKKLGKEGTAGFANAFLRRFDETKVVLPEGDEGLSVKSNFPLFAIKMLREKYGERTEQIVLARSSGVAVRFERNMENFLDREHLDSPFEGVKIFRSFAREEGYDRGDYTFQSVGSVAICEAIEPCENLLDACAAPGGKSVLLSKKCSHITACDVHPHRVSLIISYCSRMGANNVTALEKDSAIFDPVSEKHFDGVLVDAPCTGLGTVSENPDLALNKTEEDLASLQKTQLEILSNCSNYVKEGGALYYSTCSVLPPENDGTVKKFLAEHSAFSIEKIGSPLMHEITEFGLQFLPDTAFGAGFYIAKMRRK